MDTYKLLKSRRTIRKFKQTPLSYEQLLRYVDAARVAPSGGNHQPLKYAVVQNESMTGKIFAFVRWAAYLAPAYNPKDDERPTAYIVICADETVSKSGYEFDVGAAAENIVIAALADGVGSCIMGAIDREKIGGLLNLPENLKVSHVIALGYPAEEPEEVQIKEDIKYYLNDKGTLCVPKRGMDEVLLNITE